MTTKISDMTLKQIGAYLIDLADKQGVSFVLICLLAWISFSRMEAMEVKREQDIINHKKEIKDIYSTVVDNQSDVITACTKVLQENIFLMREIREDRAKK